MQKGQRIDRQKVGSGVLGARVEMHNPHCFFISINLFIYSVYFLYLYSLRPYPFTVLFSKANSGTMISDIKFSLYSELYPYS
jgi:hypothetical protein